MKIITYIKTGCPWCIDVTDYLKEKGIDHEIKNVTEDPALFDEMQQLSGQKKAPVVIIDGYMLADTDKEAVDKYLNTKK